VRLLRRLLSMVVAMALVLPLALSVPAPPPASARPELFVRAAVQSFFVLPHRRGNAYEAIEAQRDRDLASISSMAVVRLHQRDTGALTPEAYAAEAVRLEEMRRAIIERAEREKRMTRATFNRAIGDEWRAAAQNSVAVALGGLGRLGQILAQISQGKDPLAAAFQVLGGDKLEKFDAIRQGSGPERQEATDRFAQAEGLLDVLRDPKGEVRRTVRQLESMLRDEGGQLPAALSDTARRRIEVVIANWNGLQRGWRHLTTSRVRVDPQRILKDREWRELTDLILTLGSVPVVDRMLLASGVGQVRDLVQQAEGNDGLSQTQRNSVIVRVLALQLQAERDRASGVPVWFDIEAAVSQAIADVRSTPPSAADADDPDDPDGPTPQEPSEVDEPGIGADRPTGAGVHLVDLSTPSQHFPISMYVKGSRSHEGGRRFTLEGRSSTPEFQVVFDLENGTVSGWFDVAVACPGEKCATFFTSTGQVSGSFGPIPYGQPPIEVPDGFPFPEHHWYPVPPGSRSYWAGGPLEISISLSGTADYGGGSEPISGSFDDVVTGWVWSEISPGALGQPEGFAASFHVTVDHPEGRDPWWSVSFGQFYDFPDAPRVSVPPWAE
jgi:hypothetical protein